MTQPFLNSSSPKNHTFQSQKLKQWFIEEQRDLPWRINPTPYRVWVSEVMLQQTIVAVVIPYFNRWMERFPSIESLAEAPIDAVIKLWEGLGYYSRARNLHAGAKYIMEHHNGIIPSETDALKKIKGLGPYTIGAIQSFAFHQKVPAVDGNVLRVLARYFCINDDIAKSKTQNLIRQLAAEILPEDESWIVNEALIELGATICGKNPDCRKCPIRAGCQGFLTGAAPHLPIKTKAVTGVKLFRAVAVISLNEKFLVRKGKPGEIMHDLYEFPYFETSDTGTGIAIDEFVRLIEVQFSLKVKPIQKLPQVVHTFTKYRVTLSPVLFECDIKNPLGSEKINPGESADSRENNNGTENNNRREIDKDKIRNVEDYEWLDREQLSQVPFSSGHRKIFAKIEIPAVLS